MLLCANLYRLRETVQNIMQVRKRNDQFCYICFVIFNSIEIIFAYLNCFYLNFKLNLTKHCKVKVISKCWSFEHQRKIMIFKVKILKLRMDEL